jgi:hypothetical protein
MKKLLLSLTILSSLFLASCEEPKEGCTNSDAINFDSAAEENDGSCIYELTEEICIKGDIDTMCIYGTQWNYTMEIDEFVSCEGKDDRYWPEKDSGLIMMNESKLIMYDSTNDFVVLTKKSSTYNTITYEDEEADEPITWTFIKDEDGEKIMEAEIKIYNSFESCSSDVHFTLKMTK